MTDQERTPEALRPVRVTQRPPTLSTPEGEATPATVLDGPVTVGTAAAMTVVEPVSLVEGSIAILGGHTRRGPAPGRPRFVFRHSAGSEDGPDGGPGDAGGPSLQGQRRPGPGGADTPGGSSATGGHAGPQSPPSATPVPDQSRAAPAGERASAGRDSGQEPPTVVERPLTVLLSLPGRAVGDDRTGRRESRGDRDTPRSGVSPPASRPAQSPASRPAQSPPSRPAQSPPSLQYRPQAPPREPPGDSLPEGTGDSGTATSDESLPEGTADSGTATSDESLPEGTADSGTVASDESLPEGTGDSATAAPDESLPEGTGDSATAAPDESLPEGTGDSATAVPGVVAPGQTGDSATAVPGVVAPGQTAGPDGWAGTRGGAGRPGRRAGGVAGTVGQTRVERLVERRHAGGGLAPDEWAEPPVAGGDTASGGHAPATVPGPTAPVFTYRSPLPSADPRDGGETPPPATGSSRRASSGEHAEPATGRPDTGGRPGSEPAEGGGSPGVGRTAGRASPAGPERVGRDTTPVAGAAASPGQRTTASTDEVDRQTGWPGSPPAFTHLSLAEQTAGEPPGRSRTASAAGRDRSRDTPPGRSDAARPGGAPGEPGPAGDRTTDGPAGSAAVGGPGPDDTGRAGPDTVEGAGPDTVGDAGMDTVGGAGPGTVGRVGPDTVGGAGPGTTGGLGPGGTGPGGSRLDRGTRVDRGLPTFTHLSLAESATGDAADRERPPPVQGSGGGGAVDRRRDASGRTAPSDTGPAGPDAPASGSVAGASTAGPDSPGQDRTPAVGRATGSGRVDTTPPVGVDGPVRADRRLPAFTHLSPGRERVRTPAATGSGVRTDRRADASTDRADTTASPASEPGGSGTATPAGDLGTTTPQGAVGTPAPPGAVGTATRRVGGGGDQSRPAGVDRGVWADRRLPQFTHLSREPAAEPSGGGEQTRPAAGASTRADRRGDGPADTAASGRERADSGAAAGPGTTAAPEPAGAVGPADIRQGRLPGGVATPPGGVGVATSPGGVAPSPDDGSGTQLRSGGAGRAMQPDTPAFTHLSSPPRAGTADGATGTDAGRGPDRAAGTGARASGAGVGRAAGSAGGERARETPGPGIDRPTVATDVTPPAFTHLSPVARARGEAGPAEQGPPVLGADRTSASGRTDRAAVGAQTDAAGGPADTPGPGAPDLTTARAPGTQSASTGDRGAATPGEMAVLSGTDGRDESGSAGGKSLIQGQTHSGATHTENMPSLTVQSTGAGQRETDRSPTRDTSTPTASDTGGSTTRDTGGSTTRDTGGSTDAGSERAASRTEQSRDDHTRRVERSLESGPRRDRRGESAGGDRSPPGGHDREPSPDLTVKTLAPRIDATHRDDSPRDITHTTRPRDERRTAGESVDIASLFRAADEEGGRPPAAVDQLVERLYRRIERKMRIERERRGL